MSDIEGLRVQYEGWCVNREHLAGMEAEGDFPRADEWHWSDDNAVELMHEMAAALFTDEPDSAEVLHSYLMERAASKAARSAIATGDPSTAATGAGSKQ